MKVDDRTAKAASGRSRPPVDFQVSRKDEMHWTIQPVSEKARALAAAEFGLDGGSPRDGTLVAGYVKSNALLHALRSRGFSILYDGPAGPITL
jgi:hypothetical protein